MAKTVWWRYRTQAKVAFGHKAGKDQGEAYEADQFVVNEGDDLIIGLVGEELKCWINDVCTMGTTKMYKKSKIGKYITDVLIKFGTIAAGGAAAEVIGNVLTEEILGSEEILG